MTFPELSMHVARARRQSVLARWDDASVRSKAQVKVAVLLVAVVGAYHYSLSSLLQTLGFDTPLAYVGLVPFLAAGLAWLRRYPAVGEPAIHDRQLDYIIGVPLVAGAVLMDFVLPKHFGDMYWVDRLDLLSLPFFVAGAVALLFGTRVLWRQRVAVLYLFLAWPWPYTTILLGTLGGFTDLTLRGLKAALTVLPVAKSVPGVANAGLFTVSHHGSVFPVDVVTACSGVDGMVGFFLVGAGFVTLVRGPLLRKTVWLAVGLALLWATNIGRLLLIFWIGQRAGEHIALGIVHPFAGVVIFCLGIVLMMALLRPFGLHLADFSGHRLADPQTAQHKPTVARQAVPRVFMAGAGLLAIGGLLAINNSTLKSFDPVASAAGAPKLASFIAHPPDPAGWSAAYETTYSINKPLFGESSLWYRYIYTETPAHNAHELGASLPITADVINAGGLSGFEEYGADACYTFHGYEERDVAKVALGNGVTGQALSYASANGSQDWTIVYWILPVKMASTTRYERTILYIQDSPQAKVTIPGGTTNVSGLKGALNAANPSDEVLIRNRAFLVAFARQVITAQTHQSDTSTTLAAVTDEHGGVVMPQVTPRFQHTMTPRERRTFDRLIRERERRGLLPNGSHGIYVRPVGSK